MGDFNSVLYSGDRIRGNDATESEMDAFGECLAQCGLQEFGFTGAYFTWTNKIIW